MNETLEIIRERYSCRDFTEQMPSNEQLNAIAQAAIQAPSGMNRQHWHVFVVTNAELISEMEQEGLINLKNTNSELYERVQSRNSGLFYHAPCMLLFAIKAAQPAGGEYTDLGITAQNAVIAAESLGLASLHCGMANLAFAGNKRDYFKNKLGFPEGYECGLAVLVGTAKNPGDPHEPDQSKITFIA